MNQGWQCPGCGRCYAPWMAHCTGCQPGVTFTSKASTHLPLGRCPEKDPHPPHEFLYSATPFWCQGRGDEALGEAGRCMTHYAVHDMSERCVLYRSHVEKGISHRFIFERPVALIA